MSKYVIIGGVAGGATTAARLRRLDENAEIILFERGEHISYANCGLPYYIGNTISERDHLFLQTPEAFFQRYQVQVRVNQEVTKIDRSAKTVTVKDLITNETYEESYEKLILSPGADPVRPPIPGIENNKIFTLRNVTDTDQIKGYLEEHNPKRAVIVGAGFIGLEMAENLHQSGVFVTIVEMAKQVMNVLDFDMASIIHQHLKMKGVEFYLNDGVASFTDKGDYQIVNLTSGKSIEADMVILSIGVKPEITLAKEAELDIGDRGGIKVNDYLQTNDPDIYALGDAVEVKNPVIDRQLLIPLAGPANKQGRIVADNIVLNNQKKFKGTISTAIAKVFDITVASTGVSEKLLKQFEIPYHASITHSSSHAGYYPGAIPMTIKLLFSPKNGQILGAQAVGYDGVDKRIDIIAASINHQGTIYDLMEFEQAYAPPYSSAKDPVNIAGFVAENILTKRMQIIHWHQLAELDHHQFQLVDVRTAGEFALGSIHDAVNIPVDELRERLSEIDSSKKIVIFCQVGLRGYLATRMLMQNGFTDVVNLSGGYKLYELVTQKQSNEDIYDDQVIGKDDVIYSAGVETKKKTNQQTIEVNACGLQCPGPIRRLKEEIDKIAPYDVIHIKATDPGFFKDVKAWCNVTGNHLMDVKSEKGTVEAVIEKGPGQEGQRSVTTQGNNKTMVVFSNDFDRALASFVIANGALAMGKKVTLFFTFWGLNVLRRKEKVNVKKDFVSHLFGRMLPRGSKQLKLSKMNMSGIGTAMMRDIMKKKNVDSLEFMIENSLKNGIELIACQMSMDIMGIKKEELIEGVKIGGVASYLEEAEQSNVNLFI
ncbi:MAG: CoA-disulfide reductase [Spirochaetes bacterium]|nr:CoA-disulfide reductase [Spirochaetota bacterium]